MKVVLKSSPDNTLNLSVYDLNGEVYTSVSFCQWDDETAQVIAMGALDRENLSEVLPIKKAVEMFNGLLNTHFKNDIV